MKDSHLACMRSDADAAVETRRDWRSATMEMQAEMSEDDILCYAEILMETLCAQKDWKDPSENVEKVAAANLDHFDPVTSRRRDQPSSRTSDY